MRQRAADAAPLPSNSSTARPVGIGPCGDSNGERTRDGDGDAVRPAAEGRRVSWDGSLKRAPRGRRADDQHDGYEDYYDGYEDYYGSGYEDDGDQKRAAKDRRRSCRHGMERREGGRREGGRRRRSEGIARRKRRADVTTGDDTEAR
eukprot:5354434-Prymnesium_polylepis.1